jgi:hypothetical protein
MIDFFTAPQESVRGKIARHARESCGIIHQLMSHPTRANERIIRVPATTNSTCKPDALRPRISTVGRFLDSNT